MTTLTDCLRSLLTLARSGPTPTAEELCAQIEPTTRHVERAGPYLVTPVWAYGVSGADDLFAELEPSGDVLGIRFWNDSRGGACAEITVQRGMLSEVEAVLGPTRDAPRRGPLFAVAFAAPTDPSGGGRCASVTIQHQNGNIRSIMVQFG